MRTPSDSDAGARHYPLDLPTLPFERYEHRRLTARDILVSRIMTKIMSPKSGGSQKAEATSRALGFNASYPVGFSALKHVDPELYAELTLLRKMLYTTSAQEPHWGDKYSATITREIVDKTEDGHGLVVLETIGTQPRSQDRGPWATRPTVGDLALDLVRRYYLEQDDASMRLWFQAQRPPRTRPAQTSLDASQAQNRATNPASRARLVQEFDSFVDAFHKSERKTWLPEDTALLRSLQDNTRTAQANFLFDGGIFLPRMHEFTLAPAQTQHRYKLYSLIHRGSIPLPIGSATTSNKTPLRHIFVPPWASRTSLPYLQMLLLSRYDFALGRTSKGLDRDGAWSTASWHGDIPGGRLGRATRKRATSEPPPRTFTSAQVAIFDQAVMSLLGTQCDLIFPRMSLATMDRRARRRSLSRTRVAEMFDWNHVQKDHSPGPGPSPEGSRGRTPNRWVAAGQVPPIDRGLPTNHTAAMLATSEYTPFSVDSQDPLSRTTVMRRPGDGSRLTNEMEKAVSSSGNRTGPLRLELDEPSTLLPPCANCFDSPRSHKTADCHLSCGYCGAPTPKNVELFPRLDADGVLVAGQHRSPHLAPQCPVAPTNRCKCTPFPTFHVAAKCPVVCSRPCGNEHPTGQFKHRNAMMCKSRCCMCGLKGHSGSQCKLKKCRCGGHHLGQDCGWKPECRVPGCTRYLCGLHCCECGRERETGKGGLVNGRCETCLQKSGLVTGTDDSEAPSTGPNGEQNKQRKRKEKQSNKLDKNGTIPAAVDKVEEPSWLPLRPRSTVKPRK